MLALFFHVCTTRNWREIFNELYEAIKTSGLYDKLDKFYIGLLEDEPFDIEDPKFEIVYRGTNLEAFERPTLASIKKFNWDPEDRILYIHMKGLRGHEFQNAVTAWRKYMTYFTIENYQDCLEALSDDYDACGVNWHTEPWKHFSGNFWWITGSYANKLTLENLFKPDRYQDERWVGTADPKVWCFHESHVHHYLFEYEPKYYQ